MKKVKRLVVANGKYTDGAGVEKTRWLTIGAMLKKGRRAIQAQDRLYAGRC